MAHFEENKYPGHGKHQQPYSQDHEKHCQTHMIEHFGNQICQKNMIFSTLSIFLGTFFQS